MQRLGLDAEGQRQAIAAFARGKTGRDSLRAPLRVSVNVANALLRACWRMAWVDGRVDQAERELIMLWGKWLQVSPPPRRSSVMPMHRSAGVADAERGKPTSGLEPVECQADAEPAQIKQAYRRLLSRHHPDKLAGSGASRAWCARPLSAPANCIRPMT